MSEPWAFFSGVVVGVVFGFLAGLFLPKNR